MILFCWEKFGIKWINLDFFCMLKLLELISYITVQSVKRVTTVAAAKVI